MHKHKIKQASAFNLEILITSAWSKQSWWLWLLLPFTWLYAAVIFIRRYLYSHKYLEVYKAPVPVMIVGNITIGGSGKTPLIIELVNYLKSKDIQVGVISRGYGGDQEKMPCMVTQFSQPNDVGDEPCLIVEETNVAMSVCSNRQQAIECLLINAPHTQLIIADDGLQHYKLHRDIEWIVVDSTRGFGNKQLLPTGYLREPLSRLKDATVIYHLPQNAADKSKKCLTMHLAPDSFEKLQICNPQSSCNNDNEQLSPLINNCNTLKKVYAMSGIGYPKRFFETLTEMGFDVIEIPKPDHHHFTIDDFNGLCDYPVIITAKDAVKVKGLLNSNSDESWFGLSIWVLKVNATLSVECYETLDNQLNMLNSN